MPEETGNPVQFPAVSRRVERSSTSLDQGSPPTPADAEPSTITDFNGFIGLTYVDGMVTRTNTATGEVRRLPFLASDMRFIAGVYRDVKGRLREGAFALV